MPHSTHTSPLRRFFCRVPNSLRLALALALSAVSIACDGPAETETALSPRSAPVPAGEVVTKTPSLLDARPIDLALFTGDDVRQRVSVSSDDFPNGRGDLPWIKGAPLKHFASTEFLDGGAAARQFDARNTPYWCAVLPASVTVDLGGPCYVSEIIVTPFFGKGGGFRLTAALIDEDGSEVSPSPSVDLMVSEPEQLKRSAAGLPFSVEFHPKLAHKVRLNFVNVRDARSYFHSIRILGHRAGAPSSSLEFATADERARVESASTDVARFAMEQAAKNVLVSESRQPNGSKEAPWVAKSAPAEGGPAAQYWCAAAPGWVEVQLPALAIIHRVAVQAFTERHGVSAFYAKIVMDDGTELDTSPAIELSRAAEMPAQGDVKPGALIADFEPVRASRIKFYFQSPGADGGPMYVEDIRVFGVPVEE